MIVAATLNEGRIKLGLRKFLSKDRSSIKMSDRVFEGYPWDLVKLILEEAKEAKSERDRNYDKFNAGYLMAWYAIMSLMQSQACVGHEQGTMAG